MFNVVAGPGPAAGRAPPVLNNCRFRIVVGPGPAVDDPPPYLGGPAGITEAVPISGRLLRMLPPEVRGSWVLHFAVCSAMLSMGWYVSQFGHKKNASSSAEIERLP
jgi:hypothetical protein